MDRILAIDDDRGFCALIQQMVSHENLEADCCSGKTGKNIL